MLPPPLATPVQGGVPLNADIYYYEKPYMTWNTETEAA